MNLNIVSLRRLSFRLSPFIIAILFLTLYQSSVQLNSSWFESVFLDPLPLNIFENNNTQIPVPSFSNESDSGFAKDQLPLGVASSITILSLPTRLDRRQDMDALRHLLGVPESEWKYADAIPSTEQRVALVLEWVQYVRSTLMNVEPPADDTTSGFSWPEEGEIEHLVNSDVSLDIWDPEPWMSPFQLDPQSDSEADQSAIRPLVPCMINDFKYPFSGNLDETTKVPRHKILTLARVACWYSHLEAIQTVANIPIHRALETTIILEDDVDVESDIEEQLSLLWDSLPQKWDIVFLGHCWSNESYHAALSLNHSRPFHNLHPSHHPQCTHAYALSRKGARRILAHLRYPPFAFSRAIDQAFAWLVESGRIRAFSVVPSLAVQMKVTESDISKGGMGSNWKEKLRNGLLESRRAGTERRQT